MFLSFRTLRKYIFTLLGDPIRPLAHLVQSVYSMLFFMMSMYTLFFFCTWLRLITGDGPRTSWAWQLFGIFKTDNQDPERRAFIELYAFFPVFFGVQCVLLLVATKAFDDTLNYRMRKNIAFHVRALSAVDLDSDKVFSRAFKQLIKLVDLSARENFFLVRFIFTTPTCRAMASFIFWHILYFVLGSQVDSFGWKFVVACFWPDAVDYQGDFFCHLHPDFAPRVVCFPDNAQLAQIYAAFWWALASQLVLAVSTFVLRVLFVLYRPFRKFVLKCRWEGRLFKYFPDFYVDYILDNTTAVQAEFVDTVRQNLSRYKFKQFALFYCVQLAKKKQKRR